MKTIIAEGCKVEIIDGGYNLTSLSAMQFEMKSKLATAEMMYRQSTGEKKELYRRESLCYQDACNILGVPLNEITQITIENNFKGLRNCNRLTKEYFSA
jgi:hypothetical protein